MTTRLQTRLSLAVLVLGLLLTFTSVDRLFGQPILTAIQKVVLTDANGTVLTAASAATDNTAAQTTGPQIFGYASAATPSAVGADGRSKSIWLDTVGRPQENIAQINGVTPLMGNGATGTGSPRVTVASDNSAVSGFGVGATGSAPPANANYLGGVTSGATGGLLGGVTTCDSQAFLDMTTATTTELVALTASRKVFVCYWLAEANGSTTMTFKRGTGTNCGTGTTTISNAWELTAQTGFSGGSGLGAIFDNQNAGDALCVTSSAAVNLHVFVRYAKY